jgi:hypothetical protein
MTRPEAVTAILGLALVISACGKGTKTEDSTSLWNGPKQVSELKVGPHIVAIPAGWRSMAELKERDLQPGPGMAVMTPETMERGALRSNIVLNWAAVAPNSVDPKNPPCAALADVTAKQFKATATDIASIHVGGDAGCRFAYANADARVRAVVRFQGDHQFVANWTHMTTLADTSDEAVWNEVLAGLHVSE